MDRAESPSWLLSVSSIIMAAGADGGGGVSNVEDDGSKARIGTTGAIAADHVSFLALCGCGG